MVQTTVRPVLLSCLLALVLTGCGASETDRAREAAQGYVKALGKSDGKGTCAHMTKGLRKRFSSAVTFANPELSGDCPKLMQAALDSIGPDQLTQFGSAKISEVKAKGSTGTFVYTVQGARINGRVAREDGSWKVSCCVPGQED
jgi:hypothetical protein